MERHATSCVRVDGHSALSSPMCAAEPSSPGHAIRRLAAAPLTPSPARFTPSAALSSLAPPALCRRRRRAPRRATSGGRPSSSASRRTTGWTSTRPSSRCLPPETGLRRRCAACTLMRMGAYFLIPSHLTTVINTQNQLNNRNGSPGSPSCDIATSAQAQGAFHPSICTPEARVSTLCSSDTAPSQIVLGARASQQDRDGPPLRVH